MRSLKLCAFALLLAALALVAPPAAAAAADDEYVWESMYPPPFTDGPPEIMTSIRCLSDSYCLVAGGSNGVSAAGLGVKVSARLASEILAVVVMRKATERLDKRAEGLLNKLLRSSTEPTDTR